MPAITSNDSQAGMAEPLFQLQADFVTGNESTDAALSLIKGPISLMSEAVSGARPTGCSCSQDR
jgi:hypothetical protein